MPLKNQLKPRELRARQFADKIMHLLHDFIPSDLEVRYKVHELLVTTSLEANLSLISIPPEWDALNELQIRLRMIETHPAFVQNNPDIKEPTP